MELILPMSLPNPHVPHHSVAPINCKTQLDDQYCEMIEIAAVQKRIGWLLSKYRIQDEVEVSDIICEAYSRAVNSLRSGREISNLHGWFRSTSHNIIREKFREGAQERKLINLLIQEYNPMPFNSCSDSFAIGNLQIDELWDRLNGLEPLLDRKILILRSQGWSMRQIADQLIQDGDCQNSPSIVSNITQRASRARRQLREGGLGPNLG
jgi:DNA-directed RNA polymerase specialized sigma24 family protein